MSTIAELETRRRALGVPRAQWLHAAGIDAGTDYRWRHGQRQPSARNLARLADALERLAVGAPRARPPAIIAAFVRAAEHMLALEVGKRRRLIAKLRAGTRAPKNQIPPARLRRLAIYIAAVELEVGNAELARAMNTTRQNIKQARDAVESLREDSDDGPISQLLERCRQRLTGST